VAGYSPAKLSQVALDTFNALTSKGLTEDQLMKVLLTPEGKNFLQSAALSPRSEKALADLMTVDQTPLEALGKWAVGTTARLGPRIGSADQPTMPMQPPTGGGEVAGQPSSQDDLQMLLEEQARRQQQGQ
jgi:hypothetical protein